MKTKKKQSKKGLISGLVIGLIVPLVGLIIFYFSKSYDMNFVEYLKTIKGIGIASPLLSLCVIPNLLAFFIFIWQDKLIYARGVMMATLLYAIAVFIIKFS